MSLFEPEFIASLQERLDGHPIYAAVETLDDLRVFMQHHVHSVWDFMSLIKYLQHNVAPARWPWTPPRGRAHGCWARTSWRRRTSAPSHPPVSRIGST